MFNYLNLLQSFAPKETLSIQKGSCVRQRYKHSKCQRCFSVCPSGALSWQDGDIHWNQKQCQNCLLCTAVCPIGALSSDDVSYVSILKKLQALDSPILACSGQARTQGHARVPCLGIFADHELLLALTVALGKPLKLDMTQCSKCQNIIIIEQLEHTIRQLPQEVRVTLIFEQKHLDFRDRQCNRREFLGLFRADSKPPSANPVDQIQFSKPTTNYRSKRLSNSRSLLLQIIKHYPDRAAFADASFWPRAIFEPSCKHCKSCTSICPTGALSKSAGSAPPPSFQPQKCVNCKLCEEFCRQSAIRIVVA